MRHVVQQYCVLLLLIIPISPVYTKLPPYIRAKMRSPIARTLLPPAQKPHGYARPAMASKAFEKSANDNEDLYAQLAEGLGEGVPYVEEYEDAELEEEDEAIASNTSFAAGGGAAADVDEEANGGETTEKADFQEEIEIRMKFAEKKSIRIENEMLHKFHVLEKKLEEIKAWMNAKALKSAERDKRLDESIRHSKEIEEISISGKRKVDLLHSMAICWDFGFECGQNALSVVAICILINAVMIIAAYCIHFVCKNALCRRPLSSAPSRINV